MMEPTHFRNGRDMKKAGTYLVFFFLLGLFSIFLREGRGHVFREWLTNVIQPERRTLLEHFLSGIACPLVAGSLVALLLGLGLTVAGQLGRYRQAKGSYLVSESTFFFLVFAAATWYFFYACYVEGEQSVEKLRAFQWDHWLMDLAGCSASCYMAYYLTLEKGWGRVRRLRQK